MQMINLTPREEQIIRIMITQGLSNKVLARRLELSESAIKMHMSNIMRKFYARNRVQMILFAQRYYDQLSETV